MNPKLERKLLRRGKAGRAPEQNQVGFIAMKLRVVKSKALVWRHSSGDTGRCLLMASLVSHSVPLRGHSQGACGGPRGGRRVSWSTLVLGMRSKSSLSCVALVLVGAGGGRKPRRSGGRM